MKLVLPHTGTPEEADIRLSRLAQLMGISCETVALDRSTQDWGGFLQTVLQTQDSCLVLNPRVMSEWVGSDRLPAELVACLTSDFPRLLVHAVTPADVGIIGSLSSDVLCSVDRVGDCGQLYEVGTSAREICGPFSGLSFGPVNAANDSVFGTRDFDASLRKLICIGGRPFMAAIKRGAAEILFIGSETVSDVHAHGGYAPVNEYFSQFMPHAMALRHIFGEECWRPGAPYGSVIIDDPLLRSRYGFVKYHELLSLMKQHKFHTTIAFVPRSYRRNSSGTVRMFRDNPEYLSICYHGNDHSQSEFASHDREYLNTTVAIAEERMRLHKQQTGLHCHRVMVFPQSDFSTEAMQVLKSRGFYGAVSSAWHPLGEPSLPPLGDICQPAILRFGGFPLFGRNAARDTRSQDVAFNVFFGRPVLTGEHHEDFKNPQHVIDAVERINAVAPDICWSSLEAVVSRAFLTRRGSDGSMQVKAYSPSVTVFNSSRSAKRFEIEWQPADDHVPFDKMLKDAAPFPSCECKDERILASATIEAGEAPIFQPVYRQDPLRRRSLGIRWNTKAFLRRRLSEMRDQYLSRNEAVLRFAQTLKNLR